VTNAGPDSTGEVVVPDILPLSLDYVSDTCGAVYDDPTHTWTWTTPVLQVAAPATCELTVEVLPGNLGEVENTAFVEGIGIDTMTANNSNSATVVIGGAVVEIPTLSSIGMLILVSLLGFTATAVLRRRGLRAR
jgi:hypothetical protein